MSCPGTQGNPCRWVPGGFCVQEHTQHGEGTMQPGNTKQQPVAASESHSKKDQQQNGLLAQKTIVKLHDIRDTALPPSMLWCSCFTVFSLKAKLWFVMMLWEGLEQTDYHQPHLLPPGGRGVPADSSLLRSMLDIQQQQMNCVNHWNSWCVSHIQGGPDAWKLAKIIPNPVLCSGKRAKNISDKHMEILQCISCVAELSLSFFSFPVGMLSLY